MENPRVPHVVSSGNEQLFADVVSFIMALPQDARDTLYDHLFELFKAVHLDRKPMDLDSIRQSIRVLGIDTETPLGTAYTMVLIMDQGRLNLKHVYFAHPSRRPSSTPAMRSVSGWCSACGSRIKTDGHCSDCCRFHEMIDED